MSQSSKDIVLAAWRTFATRDAARIEACFTEDAVWLMPPRNATAVALGLEHIDRLDRGQIANFIANDFGRLFTADVNVDFIAVYSEDDAVIVEQRTRATLANGVKYDNDYCFIFKLRDGRICRMREYMDTLRGFRQVFGEDSVRPVEAFTSARGVSQPPGLNHRKP